MRTVRFISTILFHLSRLTSILYLAIGVYALLVLLLAKVSTASWLPVNVKSSSIEIFFPFTKTSFLLGDKSWYFYAMLLVFVLYGGFFWLLSNVFNAFRQSRLFSPKAVTHLKRFYILNLTVPSIILLFLLIIGQGVTELLMITVLHAVLGIFAFFMSSIFTQGVLLQEEQDLTL